MIILSSLLIALEVFYFIMVFAQDMPKGQVLTKLTAAAVLIIPFAAVVIWLYSACMGQLEPMLWWIAIGLGIMIEIIRIGS